MVFTADNLFVFDIETIPDDEACFGLLGKSFSSLKEKREAMVNYHLEITDGKNDFLRQPFHKIVAISYLHASIEYDHLGNEMYTVKHLRSGGTETSSEKELIEGFFSSIDKLKPRIISFNGRTFDIPVLKYRAMKYGISGKSFYKLGDKWGNYNHRYSVEYHLDMIDGLSDFGASARIKLNEICAILGFPGKFGVDGSKVSELYDAGEIKKIRDYCETDVLNTYLVYLRYALHRNFLSLDNYNNSIKNILDFIELSEAKHFIKFKEAWEEHNKGDFYL